MRSTPHCGRAAERRPRDDLVGRELHHEPVQQGRDGGDDQGAGAEEQERGAADDDEVEEGEDRARAAGRVDEGAHEAEVSQDLQVRLGPRREQAPDRPVEEREGEGRRPQRVEVGDVHVLRGGPGHRHRRARARLHQDRGQQDEKEDDDPDRRQPEERSAKRGVVHGQSRFSHPDAPSPRPSPPAGRGRRRGRSRPRSYPILLISVNIGRYIAMTMPPMMTPRTKIMTGSSSLTRPATAMSTSSS